MRGFDGIGRYVTVVRRGQDRLGNLYIVRISGEDVEFVVFLDYCALLWVDGQLAVLRKPDRAGVRKGPEHLGPREAFHRFSRDAVDFISVIGKKLVEDERKAILAARLGRYGREGFYRAKDLHFWNNKSLDLGAYSGESTRIRMSGRLSRTQAQFAARSRFSGPASSVRRR